MGSLCVVSMPVSGLKLLDFPPATPTGTLPGRLGLPSGAPGYFGIGTPGTLDESDAGVDSRKGTGLLTVDDALWA